MSEENVENVENPIVGEVHLLYRGTNQVEVNSTFDVAELYLALATVQKSILDGTLNPEPETEEE